MNTKALEQTAIQVRDKVPVLTTPISSPRPASRSSSFLPLLSVTTERRRPLSTM